MSIVSAIQRWVSAASTSDLAAKLEEYEGSLSRLKPRDTEAATQIIGAIKRELESRK